MGLKFVAAVAADSSGPHFVLATRRGQRVRSGSFADESPQSIRSMVDLVVIADYGLLDTPIITTLSASPSQLQLLGAPAGTQPADRGRGAGQVAGRGRDRHRPSRRLRPAQPLRPGTTGHPATTQPIPPRHRGQGAPGITRLRRAAGAGRLLRPADLPDPGPLPPPSIAALGRADPAQPAARAATDQRPSSAARLPRGAGSAGDAGPARPRDVALRRGDPARAGERVPAHPGAALDHRPGHLPHRPGQRGPGRHS